MGLMDNIRGLFSRKTEVSHPQVNEYYAKKQLAEKIEDLVNSIKRINSFDSSVVNFYSFDLTNKDLDELQRLYSSLEKRLSELNNRKNQMRASSNPYEDAKWTGTKIGNMTDHDLDRWQNDDGR